MKKINIILIIFVLLLSTFAIKALFTPGFFTSHDGILHIARQHYYIQAVLDGQFPPRWAGGAYNNFGYPLFIFSYRLPYFFGSIFYFLGTTVVDSVKITFIAGFLLSGITMYLLLNSYYGKIPAFIGAIIYQFAPYRFLNIFVRAALAESFVFVFLPLIFLAIYKLSKEDKIGWNWIILGSISLAAIILSNLTVLLVFVPCIISNILYLNYKKLLKRTVIRNYSYMFLLGIALSSYYLVPAVVERSWINYSNIININFIKDSFLSLRQLIYSRWGYGWMRASEGAMSFQLGIAQWTVVITSILLLFWKGVTKGKNRFISSDFIYWLVIFSFSIFMMLKISFPVWNSLKTLWNIQFVWRFLSLAIFSVAFLAALIAKNIKQKDVKWSFVVIITILCLYANRNHWRINQAQAWSLEKYLQVAGSTASYDEFRPIWVDKNISSIKKPKVELSSITSNITVNQNLSNRLDFVINVDRPDLVKINMLYYPGWNLSVNNKIIELKPSAEGLIEIPVSSGRNNFILSFSETPLRLVSDFISLFALLLIPVLWRKASYEKN